MNCMKGKQKEIKLVVWSGYFNFVAKVPSQFCS